MGFLSDLSQDLRVGAFHKHSLSPARALEARDPSNTFLRSLMFLKENIFSKSHKSDPGQGGDSSGGKDSPFLTGMHCPVEREEAEGHSSGRACRPRRREPVAECPQRGWEDSSLWAEAKYWG